MTNHDPDAPADVSDGKQVVDGVAPPTNAEFAHAAALTDEQLQADIDAHVAEVNIHDRRNR